MFDYRILRTFSIRFLYFAASFPVVNTQCAVFFVSEYHIYGARNPQFFVEYRPFRPIWLQVRIILYKLFEILVFDTVVFAWALIVEALDVVVHGRSGSGGFIAILVPSRLDLVRRLSIILTFSPFFGAHH